MSLEWDGVLSKRAMQGRWELSTTRFDSITKTLLSRLHKWVLVILFFVIVTMRPQNYSFYSMFHSEFIGIFGPLLNKVTLLSCLEFCFKWNFVLHFTAKLSCKYNGKSYKVCKFSYAKASSWITRQNCR